MDMLLLKVAYPLTPSGSIHTWKTIVSQLRNQVMSTWELEFYGYMEQCGAVLLLWIQYQRHKSDFLYCPFVPLNLWHFYYKQVKIYYCHVMLCLKTGSIGRSEILWTQTCDWNSYSIHNISCKGSTDFVPVWQNLWNNFSATSSRQA